MEQTDSSDDEPKYVVVVNHEEQYSIWRADRSIPQGWHALGGPKTKRECLEYIEEAWTDMRPLSLRRAMAINASIGLTAVEHMSNT